MPFQPEPEMNNNSNSVEVSSLLPVNEVTSTSIDDVIKYTAGTFVACTYNSNWYIGQITDVDEEEKEVEVNFMEKSKILYRWPSRRDEIWVSFGDIICEVKQLKPSCKSQRNFVLDKDDQTMIESNLKTYRLYYEVKQ